MRSIGRWWRELLRYGGVVLLGAFLLQGWALSWWLLERTWQRLWGELQLQLFCPTEEVALELQRWLSTEPLVTELRRIPPQQGWHELQRWLGIEAELPEIPDSLLPSVLIARLHMEEPSRIAELLERIRHRSSGAELHFPLEQAQRLWWFRTVGQWGWGAVGATMAALLGMLLWATVSRIQARLRAYQVLLLLGIAPLRIWGPLGAVLGALSIGVAAGVVGATLWGASWMHVMEGAVRGTALPPELLAVIALPWCWSAAAALVGILRLRRALRRR